jgi:hypothetical protein
VKKVKDEIKSLSKNYVKIYEYLHRILERKELLLDFAIVLFALDKPGSSVSIVSGYGLDDRAIQVRFQEEAKEFFL